MYSNEVFWIAAFDNGAFQHRRELRDDTRNVSWVSGDPLLVGSDGVSNDPAASAAEVSCAIGAHRKDVLARTAGSFAALSWNKQSRTLVLAADKLALRPIYVYGDGGVCIFATNLRTLRKLVDGPMELDEQGLAELACVGQQLGSRTIYKKVRVLRPAELLTINGTAQTSDHYFDWAAVPRTETDEASLPHKLHGAFMAAVRRRARSESADALLSGGLDSRCVVAGLLDCGLKVRTLSTSYPDSADEVIAKLVADKFGTGHISVRLEPTSRVWVSLIPHTLIVAKTLPALPLSAARARTVWGGDGGSVGMGHVYLDEHSVAVAAGEISDATVCRVFPKLKSFQAWLLGKRQSAKLRQHAIDGVRAELQRTVGAPADRRLFLYYLLNDQTRHLYTHFEEIDLSVEVICPFFDFDFLELIVAEPVRPFLLHHLYNRWLAEFLTPAASLPWQVYPEHEGCPHPMPPGIRSQWETSWYRGIAIRRQMDLMIADILGSGDSRLASYITMPVLSVLRLLNRCGIDRLNWEVRLAHRMFQAIVGVSGDEHMIPNNVP
jgi:hypothetical protein